MKRSRKLGLVVALALALAGLASAAPASATDFVAKEYPATLKAAVGEGKPEFTAFGQVFTCYPPTFRSSLQKGPSETLESSVFEAAGSCTTKEGTRPLYMGTCTFTLEPGPQSLAFAGKVAIGPPGCGPMVIENAFGNCEFYIEPGSKYSGTASFKNKSGAVNVTTNMTGLKVSSTGPPACFTSTEFGTWNPAWAVTAVNEASNPISLELVAPSPVASYNFNEGEGTTVHDSTGKHDGTLKGGATWGQGYFDYGLEFDGVDDYVEVADAEDLDLGSALTVEAWVLPYTHSGGTIVQKLQAGEGGKLWGYALNAGSGYTKEKPAGAVGSSSGGLKEVLGPAPLLLNEWSHLAVTSDGTTLRLYVNGSQVATETAAAVSPTTGPLKIGKGITGVFNGVLDDLRIYHEVLSANEIKAEMTY